MWILQEGLSRDFRPNKETTEEKYGESRIRFDGTPVYFVIKHHLYVIGSKSEFLSRLKNKSFQNVPNVMSFPNS